MNEKVTEIINKLNDNDIIVKLKNVKEEIKKDDNALALIKKFELSKELYEKYGYSKDFIQDKINLMGNNLIKKYLEIQNEINLLSLHINKRIEELTKDTTCFK